MVVAGQTAVLCDTTQFFAEAFSSVFFSKAGKPLALSSYRASALLARLEGKGKFVVIETIGFRYNRGYKHGEGGDDEHQKVIVPFKTHFAAIDIY